MYVRGELRLPEIQRQYVWRATRGRGLLDSLYRGYPSGSILMGETDEAVATNLPGCEMLKGLAKWKGEQFVLDAYEQVGSKRNIFQEVFSKITSKFF